MLVELLGEQRPYHKAAVAEAASRLRLQFDRTAILDLAAEIEWAKVNLLTPQSYAARARASRREPPGVDLTAMARLFEAYEEVKQRRGVIDFEDVLLLTVGILAERDDVAREVRGSGGFGYDVLFEADEAPGVTTAELTPADKDAAKGQMEGWSGSLEKLAEVLQG